MHGYRFLVILSLICSRDNRKDYEKGYKKFLGLVKKQEQLLRGNCVTVLPNNSFCSFKIIDYSYLNKFLINKVLIFICLLTLYPVKCIKPPVKTFCGLVTHSPPMNICSADVCEEGVCDEPKECLRRRLYVF